jgi:hypothetical protein
MRLLKHAPDIAPIATLLINQPAEIAFLGPSGILVHASSRRDPDRLRFALRQAGGEHKKEPERGESQPGRLQRGASWPSRRYPSFPVNLASCTADKSMKLAVCCLRAPCDLAQEDHKLSVEDCVSDSVVSHAYPIEVLFQVNAAHGPGLIAKRAHRVDYALSILGGHSLQVFLNVFMELQ